jgi:hypothetical protein
MVGGNLSFPPPGLPSSFFPRTCLLTLPILISWPKFKWRKGSGQKDQGPAHCGHHLSPTWEGAGLVLVVLFCFFNISCAVPMYKRK